jgi:hypothetical protein
MKAGDLSSQLDRFQSASSPILVIEQPNSDMGSGPRDMPKADITEGYSTTSPAH